MMSKQLEYEIVTIGAIEDVECFDCDGPYGFETTFAYLKGLEIVDLERVFACIGCGRRRVTKIDKSALIERPVEPAYDG